MRWSWPGAVALVLAVTVGAGWAVAMVLAVMDQDDLSSSSGGALLYVLGGTLSGGVIGWLGGSAGKHRRDDDR